MLCEGWRHYMRRIFLVWCCLVQWTFCLYSGTWERLYKILPTSFSVWDIISAPLSDDDTIAKLKVHIKPSYYTNNGSAESVVKTAMQHRKFFTAYWLLREYNILATETLFDALLPADRVPTEYEKNALDALIELFFEKLLYSVNFDKKVIQAICARNFFVAEKLLCKGCQISDVKRLLVELGYAQPRELSTVLVKSGAVTLCPATCSYLWHTFDCTGVRVVGSKKLYRLWEHATAHVVPPYTAFSAIVSKAFYYSLNHPQDGIQKVLLIGLCSRLIKRVKQQEITKVLAELKNKKPEFFTIAYQALPYLFVGALNKKNRELIVQLIKQFIYEKETRAVLDEFYRKRYAFAKDKNALYVLLALQCGGICGLDKVLYAGKFVDIKLVFSD